MYIVLLYIRDQAVRKLTKPLTDEMFEEPVRNGNSQDARSECASIWSSRFPKFTWNFWGDSGCPEEKSDSKD